MMATGSVGRLMIGEHEVAVVTSWEFATTPSIIDEFDWWFLITRLRCERRLKGGAA